LIGTRAIGAQTGAILKNDSERNETMQHHHNNPDQTVRPQIASKATAKTKAIMLGLDLIIISLLLSLDQWTKQLATLHLQNKPEIPIWDGVLELRYLENRGAAFGLLNNQKGFILFVTFVFMLVLLFFVWKLPNQKKFRSVHILLSFIIAGGLGNMLDRFRLDYVIDFIYFVLIDFPIFNLADTYVTVAIIVLSALFLFVFQEKDFDFLSFKQNQYREMK
jgi:signal peptidase II